MYVLFIYAAPADDAERDYDPTTGNPFSWHAVDHIGTGVGCITRCGLPIYTQTVMTVDFATNNKKASHMTRGEPGCAECFASYGLAFLTGIEQRLDFDTPTEA